MTNFIDYQGMRCGKLYVSHRVKQTTKHDTTWFCICDCRNSLSITQTQLKAGRTDCGCVIPLSKGGKFSQSRQALKMHEAIETFLYQYRRKYAVPTDQWYGPLPESRYCQIPQDAPTDRMETYLREMRQEDAGSKTAHSEGNQSEDAK